MTNIKCGQVRDWHEYGRAATKMDQIEQSAPTQSMKSLQGQTRT